MSERKVAIGYYGPKCPNCGTDGFDDWWHNKTTRRGDGLCVSLRARLKCHGCGRFFSTTQYVDGVTHSVSGDGHQSAEQERE